MKKLLTVLLALMLVFALSLSLVACDNGGNDDGSNNGGNNDGGNGGNDGGNGGNDGGNDGNDGGDAVVDINMSGLLFVDDTYTYGMQFGNNTVKFVSKYDSADDEIQEVAYTVEGNVVTIDFNETQVSSYALVDGKLVITTTDDGDEYSSELTPVGDYVVDENGISGAFTMEMGGAVVTYTFADGKITMHVEVLETTQTQVMPYTASNGVLTMRRVVEITVEDDSFEYQGEQFKKTEFGLLLSYEQYVAAELDTAVTVEFFVQATQSWWSDEGQGKITVYGQDYDGGYFAYELACTEEDAAKLVPGTAIRVFGYKGEWSGEVEIMDGTFEFVEGDETYTAGALDVTEYLGTDELINYQNMYVAFNGLTVVASQDADKNDVAFIYKWDGSGQRGDDIYFKATDGENVYTFVLESYLTNSESEVYLAAEALEIGDVINMEGFLYWYEGAQPHIVSITTADAGVEEK